mmetsp:Transcript_26518/g.72884  ORF Transcript_26518/g.72884 Transcript_26518/m.72884 type:complete len:92 (+) Transcript_26518:862-1137(+)
MNYRDQVVRKLESIPSGEFGSASWWLNQAHLKFWQRNLESPIDRLIRTLHIEKGLSSRIDPVFGDKVTALRRFPPTAALNNDVPPNTPDPL